MAMEQPIPVRAALNVGLAKEGERWGISAASPGERRKSGAKTVALEWSYRKAIAI